MADDLAVLNSFFASGPCTVRADAGGVLVGHDEIAAFRAARGGAPARRILRTEVRPIGDSHAVVVTTTAPERGGRGQQTQVWRRDGARWVIIAAQVSSPPAAIDGAVWRVVGTPLIAGAAGGADAGVLPLSGFRVAVKDLFDVEGFALGAGVPKFLAFSAPAVRNAPAVAALLAEGADVTGIARTDEFAYSIAGRNPHYGTPLNPAVTGGIPGGSSNGPASAVALGQADIGLGTDTGGSIRVPASYQGLWGLRTTHGAVDRGGLLPLAPSFDTIGWLTRDAATLRAVVASTVGLMPAEPSPIEGSVRPSTRQRGSSRPSAGAPGDALSTGFVVCPELTALADETVQHEFAAAVAALDAASLVDGLDDVAFPPIDELFETFRTVQAVEAWREHGPWITAHPDSLGSDIAARFAWASEFSEQAERDARTSFARLRSVLDLALAGRVLLLPSASSVAPQVTATHAENEVTRAGTLRLVCVAGLLGAPALSVPLLTVPLRGPADATEPDAAEPDAAEPGAEPRAAQAPVGLCLVGPRFSDLALIDLAIGFARVLAGVRAR